MDGFVQTIGGVQGHLPKPAVLVSGNNTRTNSNWPLFESIIGE